MWRMRYIGGKVKLLSNITSIIKENTSGGERVFCDIFSGTGRVAAHFKPKYEVHSNDFLHFSFVIQKALIENNKIPLFSGLVSVGIADPIAFLEEADLTGMKAEALFITENYAPNINCARMYISKRNAMRIDFIRNTIEAWKTTNLINETEYYYLLASLIQGVPFVSNITGTYGAYLKTWDKRAFKEFEMARFDVVDNGKKNRSYNVDANALIRELEGDIIYIDPPYNARQYAPNYHLLETISRYDYPEVRGVTGMRPYDDIKSAFCIKADVLDAFESLIAHAKFNNIVMSYSTDGLMSCEQIETVLKKYGDERSYKRYDIPYRKYKSKIYKEEKLLNEIIFFIRKNLPKPVYVPVASASKSIKTKTAPIKYNRTKFLKSPLNYIGGKHKLLPQLMPLFPKQMGCFVDLFAGGCNVGINIKAEKIVCNDLNTKIINMYNVFQQTDTHEILHHINNRIDEFDLSKTNEQGFLAFRKYYNELQNPIDLYVLACFSFNYQFRFNNNHAYNNPFGRNRSQFSGNMKNNLMLFLDRIKHTKIKFVSNDFIDFDYSMLGDGDVVYCDPPYLITTGSYNDGNRGFKDWKEEDEIALYALLDKLHQKNVKFALSNVITHKGVRNEILLAWCKKYIVTTIESNYANASYNTKREGSSEVLVTNY